MEKKNQGGENDLPKIILEIANAHGGNFEVLNSIVNEISKIEYSNKAIKFQPFKPDLIALPDFEWYPVYKELYFNPDQWNEILFIAKNVGNIWLDLFDLYGVEIFASNKQIVEGIKFQASVLDNFEVISALSKIPLNNTYLMINISGYEISQIEYYVKEFQKLNPKEIILQIGFQSYPTLISDTGLHKISVIKAAFPHTSICFADHSPADMPVSLDIPIWALITGCDIIEKHCCLNRTITKYDHHSALQPEEIMKLISKINDFQLASHGLFISKCENEYLQKTIQVPVACKELPEGSMIGLSDVIFRRTNQLGLKLPEISSLQTEGYILNKPIIKNLIVRKSDFKKARIAVLVACRMKSSRLKNKAILPIHGIPSIERCLQNCLEFPCVDDVVLTTSDLDEDAILGNYTLNGQVKFWQGDPDDVIMRYLGVCDKLGIDIIYRVTGDCPVVSSDIAEILLASHLKSGADYSAAKSCSVGSCCEIYNTEALRRVIKLMGKAEYSEYMTWYMQNNPDIFKVNIVDLPPEYVREYRLTLDYEEDLEMFNALYVKLEKEQFKPSILNIFNVLDNNSEIYHLNSNITQFYHTNKELIELLNRVTKIKK
ncbi:N-acetylneuraminate synthase family protein [Methanospirillum sp. J.3.6.1-F.2.7.3]|uniref:N-acetylneuraminate synthase family protein n=1 Tax=Methanospirillum purgamenti TaxID=2834276 RepID=A0A8E7EK20_9EURY|nr:MULTISPECIES: N-acetylneuraminate synthase family protein [Methanospirillum]MDX8549497.1 N-acetylneuraminate synthase family protein [Methanospirillum hungatei]QVV89221.1 N-acetylneuraminate synthase family protein [Methanospirillum sp. J.3.6.1-F.2.7.3]